MNAIRLSELEASRVETLAARRRALMLERELIERDEFILKMDIQSQHKLEPGVKYTIDMNGKQIVPTDLARAPFGVG